MEQITTTAPAHTPPPRARAAAATVADLTRPPRPTVTPHGHAAAAAYPMNHAATTALTVLDAHTGQPAGITTSTDIAHAIADGKDVNDVRVGAVMTTRPAITATATIRDAAKIMTASHLHHLPAAGDTGLLGLVDTTDVRRALTNTRQR